MGVLGGRADVSGRARPAREHPLDHGGSFKRHLSLLPAAHPEHFTADTIASMWRPAPSICAPR